jgi:hypothetical protein
LLLLHDAGASILHDASASLLLHVDTSLLLHDASTSLLLHAGSIGTTLLLRPLLLRRLVHTSPTSSTFFPYPSVIML